MGPKKILLVDDSATMISLEKLVLRDEGLEMFTATNGRQALDVAMKVQPDLILLDIVMPEMDGIECCRRLKANPLTQHVPIVMVTTKGNSKMVDAAFEAGCDDFVTKPIDKIDLVHKVKKHVGPSERTKDEVSP